MTVWNNGFTAQVVTRPPLVDRHSQLEALRALAVSGRKQLVLLFGRRQVGKTYLLQHAWRGARVFRFQAAALTPDLNRQDFLRDLAEQFAPRIEVDDYPNWRAAFRVLAELARAAPLVAILDEFQYLLDDGDAVPSQLTAVWDSLPSDLPFTLILCGSEVSAMEQLTSGGAPLYGRVTATHSLQPFDYRDAAEMAPWLDSRDAAYLFGILGGMPRYLAAVAEGESIDQAIVRVFVAASGEVRGQMATLIEQEKGIRRPAEYRSVLEAVAGGRTLLNEIVVRTGLEAYSVRSALKVLEALMLVSQERNFEAPVASAIRYRISDNAVAFWHHFLVPRRTRLAMDPPVHFWRERILPGLDAYMGYRFERMVRQAYARYHAEWRLAPAEEWARWEGQARDRQPVEIDIAARLADGRLLAGEIKWSSDRSGPRLHTGLVEKLARLAASGQGWAKDIADATLLYVSAAGFAPDMVQLARADERIRLLDLTHLYPGR